MTSLDILFWLMIVLLGGVAWAIEAGLGYKHRRLLLSSTLAAFGASVFVMFWLPDHSILELGERAGKLKKKKGNGNQRGEFEAEFEEGGVGPSAGPTPQSGSGSSGQPGAPGAAGQPGAKPEEDLDAIEYRKDAFRDCKECPLIVLMSTGTFTFGTPMDEPGREPDELGARSVYVGDAFAIGKMEITRVEFTAFVEDSGHRTTAQCDIGSRRKGAFTWKNPGFEQDGRHPVVCVNIDDIQSYLSWLSGKANRRYRLPTEIEWEYAARAGTTTPWWQGTALVLSQANAGKVRDGTIPTALFTPSKYNLVDVSGNAAEIVANCLPDPAKPAAKPGSEAECGLRIVKGGSWASTLPQTRHGARLIIPAERVTNFIGFRVARGVDERDNNRIMSREERRKILEEEKRALEIAAREAAAAEKATHERREADFKAREEAEKAEKEGKGKKKK